MEKIEKNDADIQKEVAKVEQQMNNAREMTRKHENEHENTEVPEAQALIGELDPEMEALRNSAEKKATDILEKKNLRVTSTEKENLIRLYLNRELADKSGNKADIQKTDELIDAQLVSWEKIESGRAELKPYQKRLLDAVGDSEIYRAPLEKMFQSEDVTDGKGNDEGKRELLEKLFEKAGYQTKSVVSDEFLARLRVQLNIGESDIALFGKRPKKDATGNVVRDEKGEVIWENSTLEEVIENGGLANADKFVILLSAEGFGDPKINQLIIDYANRDYEQKVSEISGKYISSHVDSTVQELQKIHDTQFKGNTAPIQNNSTSSVRAESASSYASFSELSTTEYKALQTPSGKEIQAKLDPKTGNVIAFDPRLQNPVDIGKPREFQTNAPILEIGLEHTELQALFYGNNLDMIKRHMKYIENSMNRPNLTIEQYEAFLLTSLVSMSHAENAEKYPTTFDATYLPQIKRYFQENRRDIMEGLRKQSLASQEYGINPRRFLERLHPNSNPSQS